MQEGFLPLCRADAEERGWHYVDCVVVTGDAYIDHPSFGAAIISRVLEAEGYRVGIISQSDFTTCESMREYGRPRLGFFIGGGNVDSMVAHYSVAKRRREHDEYTPGGVTGKRPDRCATVYTRLAKEAYPDVPVILGGLEASLRRFAHYDYWTDSVMASILEQSGADIVSYGMGEHQTREIARRLAAGEDVKSITDVAGTCYLTDFAGLPASYAECASLAKVTADKTAYARACRIQMDNQDWVVGKTLVQKQSERYLVQNPPATPLTRRELDEVYALPFTRRVHPSYDKFGGVPAIEEVEFSIIQNRGCFGGCNFCAITMHQGRRVTSRSADSVVHEAELLTKMPGFKGYIHDVGGPTANFRLPSCGRQMTKGICGGGKHCLAPTPCENLIVDHSEYLGILRRKFVCGKRLSAYIGKLLVLQIPLDRALFATRSCDLFFRGYVRFIWLDIHPISICISVCEHIVQHKLNALCGENIFLPVVVYNALAGVHNLRLGETARLHCVPKLAGICPLYRAFVALASDP